MTGTPVRIQLSRAAGWRIPDNTVKVTRPGRWGNPFNLRSSEHCWTALHHGFRADRAGRQAASVAMFRAWIAGGQAIEPSDCGLIAETPQGKVRIASSPSYAAPAPPSVADIREHLAGKNLACWCKPGEPCHADVLLELANAPGCEAVTP